MKKELVKIQKLKKYLAPILVGIVIFILSLTVFRSILKDLAELRLDNMRKKKRLAILFKKSQLLQSLDEKEIETRVQKLEEVLPTERPVLSLLASLSRLSRQQNVVFSGIELKPGKINQLTEKKELQEFIISFDIEGSLKKITSFITKLEKTAPLMKIEGIDLSLDGPKASLSVRVYYQALPETLGSIDEPVHLLSEKEKDILKEIASYQGTEVIKAVAPVGKENLFTLP